MASSSTTHSANQMAVQSVQAVLAGDHDAFGVIIELYEVKIFQYCLRLLNFNRADAEDVAANAFFKAYRGLAGYNQSLKFSSWLYRIAHNEAVSLIKKNSKFYSAELSSFEDIPVEDNPDKPHAMDLQKILSKLSIDDRTILSLFYLDELSLEEIGEVQKITKNAAAVRLNRARNRAKKFVLLPQ